MDRFWIVAWAVLGWLATAAGQAPAEHARLLPYQPAGWLTSPEQEDAAQRFLLVDLGAQHPGELPTRWTVVGSAGSSPASDYDLEKSCRFLCGSDEAETCHYVARLTVASPDDVGEPLLVLPARHPIEEVHPNVGAFGPGPDATWRAQPGPAAWPENVHYSLDTRDTGPYLTRRHSDGWESGLPLGECRSRTTGEFREVLCQGGAFLAKAGRIVLGSFADYNTPSAEIVTTLQINGRPFQIVKLGLKAQTIYGLLGPDGEAYFRPRDYPLLC